MRMELDVTVNGEPRTVVAGPAEFIRLERTYQITVVQMENLGSMEHLAFLAWSSMKREGSVPIGDDGKPLSFDAFIDALDDLDYKDTAEGDGSGN